MTEHRSTGGEIRDIFRWFAPDNGSPSNKVQKVSLVFSGSVAPSVSLFCGVAESLGRDPIVDMGHLRKA